MGILIDLIGQVFDFLVGEAAVRVENSILVRCVG